MIFYTCVDKKYKELIPLYKFCVNRAYPDAEVIVDQVTNYPSCYRFLNEIKGDYVHVTDADILILPHEKSHQEYYSRFEINGASYVRGATIACGKKWEGEVARICGGHIGLFPEFYRRTNKYRAEEINCLDSNREFDEIMLCRILRNAGYPIPKEPYTFFDGTPWDWEYRDLHLNDFASLKFKKWSPNREKVADLITDPEFRSISSNLSSYWRTMLRIAHDYVCQLV
jgi:hypothetical protein